MARTNFPDGSIMLSALHAQGRLLKVRTAEIEMTPTTSAAIQLSELNQVIAEQRGVPVDELSIQGAPDKVKEMEVPKATVDESDVAKTTSQSVNEDGSVDQAPPTLFESPEVEAKHYRSQADKLAKQAAEFRRKAEELVPTKKAK